MKPPAQTPISIKEGDQGTAVWAVQRALNSSIGSRLVEDADFGQATAKAVRSFQDLARITADGVVGPTTQGKLAAHLIALVDPEHKVPLVPLVRGESGNYIAAVNWSVPGGVDCGYTQRRIYTGYTEDDLKRAFDSKRQITFLKNRLTELYEIYQTRPGAVTKERAMRLAVLAHNYPYGADHISRVGIEGLSVYWTRPQTWVQNIRAKFADGTPVETPLEHCQHYSLGSNLHDDPGFMVQGFDFSTLG